MGTRETDQPPLWIATSDLPTSPGHPFYARLTTLLDGHHFDRFVEGLCDRFYAPVMGRPSLAPGRYFRLLLVGYFEGIDSERGIAWRATDSLAVRSFLRLAVDEAPPDHSTIARTRRLIDLETHRTVFTWVQQRLVEAGRLKGKTIAIDATTLEANAAMRSIVRRDTGESYQAFLAGLAKASGIETPTRSRRPRRVPVGELAIGESEPDGQTPASAETRLVLPPIPDTVGLLDVLPLGALETRHAGPRISGWRAIIDRDRELCTKASTRRRRVEMGKPDQGSAAAKGARRGDRRRRRARPWRPIVSGAEARSGAASVARGGSRVGVAGGGDHRGAGLAVARPVSGRGPGQPEEPGAGCPERRRSSVAGQDRRAADGERVTVREGGPAGGGRPFGPAEVEAMRGAHSISTRRAYGLQRICRVWHCARSSVYARRQATTSQVPCRRRGPVGAAPDDVLVGHIRRVLAASPFHGEGYRKAWAKLRVEGIRTSQERVRRLMREHDLQAPHRVGRAHGPKVHDGTITTEVLT